LDFRDWLPATYHDLATQYRMALQTVVTTWGRYNDGSEHARSVGIACLQDVPVPVFPKYPGTVSDEDKEWYHQQPRPDWIAARKEYEEMINKAISL